LFGVGQGFGGLLDCRADACLGGTSAGSACEGSIDLYPLYSSTDSRPLVPHEIIDIDK
jgi:hypothetical protein